MASVTTGDVEEVLAGEHALCPETGLQTLTHGPVEEVLAGEHALCQRGAAQPLQLATIGKEHLSCIENNIHMLL